MLLLLPEASTLRERWSLVNDHCGHTTSITVGKDLLERENQDWSGKHLFVWYSSSILQCPRVAEVGSLSWTVAKSLRAFVERVIANFRDKNVVFYNRAETGNLGLLWKEDILRWELYKSRMSFGKSSRKAGCLSLRAQGKQDVFHWELYESRIAFIKSSTKAGSGWLLLRALWKQDSFH